MRIAYVTEYDAADVHQWSGLGHYIARSLEQQGHQLEFIGCLAAPPATRVRLFATRIFHRLGGKTYLAGRDPGLARAYARQIQAHPALNRAEIIFSPGSIPVSQLEVALPIVIWTDATFASLVDFYPSFTNLCARSLADGHALEAAALARCRMAIYSSAWAARTALGYIIPEGKLRVVPFGANVSHAYTREQVHSLAEQRDAATCHLLFLGVDWQRKGGDTALEIARELDAHGLQVELHVAGCIPPVAVPGYVHLHGFLSKSTPEGQARIDSLMRQAHFLLLPSRADATPVVVNEAAAYGLPVLAADVGGIASLIQDGFNGRVFPAGSPARLYSDYIATTWPVRDRYLRLCDSAFLEYEAHLSWQAAGKQINHFLEEMMTERQP